MCGGVTIYKLTLIVALFYGMFYVSIKSFKAKVTSPVDSCYQQLQKMPLLWDIGVTSSIQSFFPHSQIVNTKSLMRFSIVVTTMGNFRAANMCRQHNTVILLALWMCNDLAPFTVN